jgi:phosphoglycerol transferase
LDFARDRRPFYGAVAAVVIIALPIIAAQTFLFYHIKTLFAAPTTFYEEHYINPRQVKFTPPAKLRNLVFIVVESWDTGDFFAAPAATRAGNARQSGDPQPRLWKRLIAPQNVNFSQTGGVGGEKQIYGATYSIAGLIAYETGLPLVVHFWASAYDRDGFLANAVGLGNILRDFGYRNYFLFGDDRGFASTDKFLWSHGNPQIFDLRYFVKHHLIPKDYHKIFGFEDRKLFAFAKDELPKIAAGKRPFFFTLATADSHYPGFPDALAEKRYADKYANALLDSDRQIDDFIGWLQKQPFYADTTVVVVGDHLYYAALPVSDALAGQPVGEPVKRSADARRPLNLFINAPALAGVRAKHRVFTHLDMFPTILDALGFRYDAAGLGLGRSLVKNEKTLLEIYGADKLNDVLPAKSQLYSRLMVDVSAAGGR